MLSAYVSLRLHGQFPLWNARLAAGFNLLFYGFGSKKVSPRISQIARVVRTVHRIQSVPPWHWTSEVAMGHNYADICMV